MQNWLDKVLLLLQAETSDLRELARLAGGDPRTFYRGANLDGVDFSGQDVSGMEFNGFSTSSTVADEATRIDATYRPRFDLFEDDWTQYSALDFGDTETFVRADDFLRLGGEISSNGRYDLAAALFLTATQRHP